MCVDAVPWGSVNPCWIKQAVDAGQALFADPAVPQPYYDLLLNGLKPSAQERTCSLQDLRYTLRFHLSVSSSQRKEKKPSCNTHPTVLHSSLGSVRLNVNSTKRNAVSAWSGDQNNY